MLKGLRGSSKPQTMSKPTEDQSKLAGLMEKLTICAIETPIDILKDRIVKVPRQEIVDKLNALYSEIIKLQYCLREYAIVEWYNTLDDRRKRLHDIFEKNRDFFKQSSEGKNWLFLSDINSKDLSTKIFDDKNSENEVYFTFFEDNETMKKALDNMRTSEVNKCLCTPLFNVNK